MSHSSHSPDLPRPIDVTGLYGRAERLAEISAEVLNRLETLSKSYPQVSSAAKRKDIARQLTDILAALAADGDPSMGVLVQAMRGIQMRGLGQLNELWPRLFVVHSESKIALRVGGPASDVSAAFEAWFPGYLSKDAGAVYWATAAVLAWKPRTLAELHGLLRDTDPTLPSFDQFKRAWASHFEFGSVATSSSQPDWQPYWEHERQTAYGEGYPASITSFLSTFFDSLPASRPGTRLLDVGTGNHAATLLARKHCPDFDLVGIDLAFPPQVNNSRIRVAQMNADRLAFTSATFDAAVSVNGIEYATPELALPELKRVLRPGARAALVLHRPDSLVVRRAIEVNQYVRNARLRETVALVLLQLSSPKDRLRNVIETHATAVEHDQCPPDAFFQHFWSTIRTAVRSSAAEIEAAIKLMRWCDGFLQWVVQKNDFVREHAARLGASEKVLKDTMALHGLQIVSLSTLHWDTAQGREIAGWGIIVRPSQP